MEKIDIKTLSKDALAASLADIGAEAYRVKQMVCLIVMIC